MRLHRMELTAFGPFAGHEVVDFDRLGAEGLFLLHGDTGAGKTTVLDAVAYALFGAVPGARAEAKRLRCDYADPDAHTEVSLELSVRGHRLLLTRSPEYERPKRRGDGTTKQPAKASLTWLGPAPSGHASEGVTRIDEVAREVEGLLGMTKDQFFQVVLLPQGDFAQFLRSSTEDRERLLEKLFGTQHFERVEKWFRDRRLERRHVVDQAKAESRELVARFAQAAGVEPPEEAGPVWLTEIIAGVEAADAEATTIAADAAGKRERADTALTEGRELADRVRRVRRATDDLAELAEQAEVRAQSREELAAALRAVPVVAAAEQVRRAEWKADQAEQAVRERASDAEEAGFAEPDALLSELRKESARLREEAGGLAALVAEAERQRADEARLVDLGERIEAARRAAEDIAARSAGFPERIAAARDDLSKATEARAALPGLRARKDEVAAALKDQGTLPDAEKALAAAKSAHQDAVDAHQAARDLVQDLRQRRLDGMAAELAEGLAAGESCPVCGSVEHPAPAHPTSVRATPEDEEAAQAEERRLAAVRENTANAVTQAQHTLKTLAGRLAPWSDVDLVQANASALAAFRSANELAGRHGTLEKALAALESEAEALRDKHGALEREAVSLESERTALAATVADRESTLEQARGEHASVGARRRHLLTLVTAVDALIEAQTAAVTARERLKEQRDALADVVSEAGFAGLAEALGAARADTVVDKLREQLADAEKREAASRSILADPDLFGIEADLDVDLVPLTQAAKAARTLAEHAVAGAQTAANRLREVRRLGERLRVAWEKLAPLEAEFAELDALTDVVNGRGQNSTRMSLRSYVLAARLEDIAAAGTERLRQMTQGRYSFVHSDEAGARGTRGGLGLDVLDDFSGRTRSAKTLSGGESFVASLALALGLADVVAAESGGGALLDTLFVDEGFGTLDAGTLDDVMAILDSLREGGRVVGLVSHVDELRQRIPVRLRVAKARTGSTLHLTA
ncbi:AAA family ATPase [Actinokineospora iranica]|uniref:Nuclease SbcCD subunit C n=1 Tax=Actinokineospora iranica TaxID=1271860 RepID=A0A1G6R9N1_9PSEU|nr:SMC family ATPase [Actinokineospora iranica]SDD01248.1 exonuclease SbcC [Actinokineospora iranica]